MESPSLHSNPDDFNFLGIGAEIDAENKKATITDIEIFLRMVLLISIF
jgi:hypothetical protein